jgi:hypothetical protein
VAVGPVADAPRRVFAQPEDAAELLRFACSLQPFVAAVEGETLTFRGSGAAEASAAESRMLAAWARQVAAEAASPESCYGLAFSWHRGGPAGGCDEVGVYLSGEVRARSCTWPDEVSGRLTAEALERIYGWFDALAPFQAVGEESFQIGTAQWRLIFAGRGRRQPSAAESAAVAAFGRGLHRELAARRSGGGEANVELLPAPVVPNGSPQPVRVEPPAEPPPVGEPLETSARAEPSRGGRGAHEEVPPATIFMLCLST